MSTDFSLMLFAVDAGLIQQAVAAGVDTILVDWECVGKERRQAMADTEINRHTREDLGRVRRATSARVICRVNGDGAATSEEIEAAIGEDADEILLPMVRTPAQVEEALEHARDRCGVGILVETVAALGCLEALAGLPLARVYVGLNDLAIERRTPNLFAPLVDGTLDSIRAAFVRAAPEMPFGFGGLTLPNRGAPVACRLLIGEMARLECSFSFLRRSFYRDIRGRDVAEEVPRLRAALAAAGERAPEQVARDRAELVTAIEAPMTLAAIPGA